MQLIVDHIIFSIQKYGGISNFWIKLQHTLQKTDDIKEYGILYTRLQTQEVEAKNILNNTRIYKKRALTFGKYDMILPRRVDKDLPYHSSYYTTSNSRKNIVSVYDFAHEKLNFKNRNSLILKKRALANASHFVCISKSTADDLLELYPELCLGKKIEVIPLAASKAFYPINKTTDIFKNELLFIGSRAEYKNFDIFCELCRSLTLKAVIIGGGPLNNQEIGLLKNIHWEKLDHINEAELNQVYNRVGALIYPSKYEGFGIPIIEAQQAECPVITWSTKTCVEVSGAPYLAAKNFDELKKLTLEMINNSVFRREWIDHGRNNVARYDWELTTEKYLDLYRSI